MVLKLGHDIKSNSWGKTKNIRPPSTYLFGVEEGEWWPEAAVDGGHQLGCPPQPLVLASSCPRGWAAKSGHIAILIGDIFG